MEVVYYDVLERIQEVMTDPCTQRIILTPDEYEMLHHDLSPNEQRKLQKYGSYNGMPIEVR